MRRFDCVSPIDYRYIPEDVELSRKIRTYRNLDIEAKLKNITIDLVIPRLKSLADKLFDIGEENKGKQIPRRVDGKHTGKIDIEEIFKGYAGRLVHRTIAIEHMFTVDIQGLGETQRNDNISDLVYFETSAFSVEANIANDVRHQFRSEIKEFGHKTYDYVKTTGSSTMPHKENPPEFERVVSLWKRYQTTLTSAVLCQVVEHQGDSTNELLPYLVYELSCGLCYATKHLENALKNLKINV